MMEKKRLVSPHAEHSTKNGLRHRNGIRAFAALTAVMLCLSACGAQPAPVVPASSTAASQTEASADASGNEASASATASASESAMPASESAAPSAETTASASPESSAAAAEGSPSASTTSASVTMPADRTVSSLNGQPVKVRALYLTGPKCGVALDEYIAIANETEINALVIDIKETGVNYEPNVPLCQEHKLYTKYYDADAVIKKCHENGIYVIGRIVVFRDNGLAQKMPAYAIRKPDGSFWLENKSKTGAWTSPAVPEVLEYNIAIAKDAVTRGFDEIQFDYVRFPTVTKSNQAAYPADMPDKIEVIDGFLKQASEAIKAVRDVPVSADVFGIIAESVSDGKAIGQQLEYLGMNADYLNPMVYPSHYANAGSGIMGNGVGQQVNGVLFTAPDLHPYDVVLQSLLKTKKRAEAHPGFKAGIRPYLQDFTASYIKNTAYYQTYGAKQLREQIQAVYDAGYEEWILWNGRNIYSVDGLLPESAD